MIVHNATQVYEVKVSTSSSSFPPSMIGPSLAVFILRSLVLPGCILSPTRAEMVSYSEVFSCMC